MIKSERLSQLEASSVDLVTAPELSALLRVARAAEEAFENWPQERARNQLAPALAELQRAMEKRTAEQKQATADALKDFA